MPEIAPEENDAAPADSAVPEEEVVPQSLLSAVVARTIEALEVNPEFSDEMLAELATTLEGDASQMGDRLEDILRRAGTGE